VGRIASTVLVVALLAATGAAFALTQDLKTELSPVYGTDIAPVLSPLCTVECDDGTPPLAFKLRRSDRLDVSIVDGDRVVRTLVRDASYQAGPVELEWDGRDDDGRLVPEGEYQPRVKLHEDRRVITLPNPIRIDVTPPSIERISSSRRVFSPDGDGRVDRVLFRYRLNEPGRAMLLINGTRRWLTRFPREQDFLVWNGKVGGRSLRPGTYTARIAAFDPAGNVGEQSRPFPIVLRYVALGRDRITVPAGSRFAVRISSDARAVRWRLGRRSGVTRPGTLRLRAPLQKGTFTLVVSANGHSAGARVFVREPS
jgi:flagellar hook capping protein FlgD